MIRFPWLFLCSILILSPIRAQLHWEQSGGPLGGSLNALAYDSVSRSFFTVVNSKSLFKSSDPLQGWTLVDTLPLAATDLIATPGGNLIAQVGRGLIRSVDHGLHWTVILDSVALQGIACTKAGTILALDPNDSPRSGLYRSTDNGATWTIDSTIGPYPVSSWYQINPLHPLVVDQMDRIFLSGVRLRRSTDQGLTWTVVLDSVNQSGFYSAAVSGDNHAMLAAWSDTYYYWNAKSLLWKSTSGGATWTELPLDTVHVGLALWGYTNGSVIYSSSAIWTGYNFSPMYNLQSADTRTAYLWQHVPFWNRRVYGFLELNARYYAATEAGFFVSTDYGMTWKSAQEGVKMASVANLAALPNGHLIADVGVDWIARSTNRGDRWEIRNVAYSGYFNGLRADPANGDLYTWNKSSFLMRSSDEGFSWDTVKVPESYYSFRTLVFDGHGGIIAFQNGDLYFSSDHGRAWKKHGRTPFYDYSNYSPGLASRNGGMLFYFRPGAHTGIYISSDTGMTWTQGGLYFTGIRSLAVGPGKLLIAATDDGLYRSVNDGVDWDIIDSLSLERILMRPSGILYGFFNGKLSLSRDQGVTWESADIGLPAPVTEVCFDSSGRMYAAIAGNGVYRMDEILAAARQDESPLRRRDDVLTVRQQSLGTNGAPVIIQLVLPVTAWVTMRLYDILGRELESPLPEQVRDAGDQSFVWSTRGLSTGVYFYRAEATPVGTPGVAPLVRTGKLLLIR